MSDPSNSSFIPKRGPARRKKGSVSKQLYVFTIISYVLLFSTLLATGGIYFYSQYVEGQLAEEVNKLNSEIKSFSEEKMNEVLKFDLRLAQATGRVEKSVSILSVFNALEAATIDTIQLDKLDMVRDGDETYTLETTIKTDSFDSILFQREIYGDNEILGTVHFANVNAEVDVDGEGGSIISSDETLPMVTFTATLGVPLTSIPYEVNNRQNIPLTITPEPALSLEEDVVDDEVTENIDSGVVNETDI